MQKLTATLVSAWVGCPREAWLMAHELNPDEDNPYLELGRFINKHAYSRSRRRELNLPGMKVDLLESAEGEILVVEIKKSSRSLESARMQLLFYLWRLEEYGVQVRGELRVPKERKRIPVALDPANRAQLEEAIRQVQRLVEEPLPPPPARIPYCRPCAYSEFCWAELLADAELEESAGRRA